MTDIQAAVGRVQLKRLPVGLARRRELADEYRHLLTRVPGLGLPVQPDWARGNCQSFCVRLPGGCNQREVMQRMLDAGVATRRGIMCAHREPAYADVESRSPLTESEKAQDECIILPLYHDMAKQDQERVAEALRIACSGEGKR